MTHRPEGDNPYFDSLPAVVLTLTRNMGRTRRTSTQPGLDPWRDLLVGLATAAALQASIRHADTKAAALLTIEGAVATAVVDRALPLAVGGGVGNLSLAVVLATSFVTGLAAATWHLVLALRPRLEGASGANRFGFPNLTRGNGRPPVASTRRHRDEAWDFVAALARIAMAKHLRIRRSMPWLVVAMMSASGLVILLNLGLSMMS